LLYRQAISMRSDYTQAYINRGDILLKLNRTKEAQEVYERALFYDSTNADIYYNLGVVLLEQGRHNQALAYLNKALEYDPDHSQALLNSAMLIQESGSTHLRQLALERLHKIVSSGQVNERVYFNLGMLSMDGRDLTNAELWFRKAIEVKPDFRSALFNLALLLSDSDRPLEAAPFLHQLIAKLRNLNMLTGSQVSQLERHARTLATLAATEHAFLLTRPSVVAGGALIAAFRGLQLGGNPELVLQLTPLLQCPQEVLLSSAATLDALVDSSRPSKPLPEACSTPMSTPCMSRESEGSRTPTDCHLEVV